MPTVVVEVPALWNLIGLKEKSDKEFEDLCFEFGIELEDIMKKSELYPNTLPTDDVTIYRIDIPANRYDMLCTEGIARALRVFILRGREECLVDDPTTLDRDGNEIKQQGNAETLKHQFLKMDLKNGAQPASVTADGSTMKTTIKNTIKTTSVGVQVVSDNISLPPYTYKLTKPEKMEQLFVSKETKQIRPFVVSAILRDFTFTPSRYEGFIELQDKLHNNIARKRTLVAIGTHDLDTIKGPFRYTAKAPTDISFVPLNQTKEMTAKELMTFYESDRKLSKFLHIIRDAPLYPVIYDSKDTVLSLPPIINSDHSKIKLSTRNIFIECTGTDLTKANVVLNTVVTMFSGYCDKPFTVEPVEVIYEGDGGRREVYPQFENRAMEAKVDYINTCAGMKCTPLQLTRLLSRMSLGASISPVNPNILNISIPPTRSDVIHACDVMEDAAIAYNFNSLLKTHPKSSTIAVPLPINKLGDLLRKECAYAGFTEALAFTLCSRDENFKFLGRKDPGGEAVVLANPKTLEYQVVRTSLLPGLLKTIGANKHQPLPLRLFEVSDIVLLDPTAERLARNQRNLSLVWCDVSSGFEEIRGMVTRLMEMLGVPCDDSKDGYSIKEDEEEVGGDSEYPGTFFPGRSASLLLGGKKVGSLGIIHPLVLENFEIPFPCSALEFNVEPFL